MNDIIKILPNTFIPLFVAMNVFLLLPIFVNMTYGMSRQKQKEVVRDSIITALIVSLVFIALGKFIFDILGITPDDFKIAGGIVLLIFAIHDLTQSIEKKHRINGKVGVVPIGVPLIVGPAVLTNILLLVDNYGVAPTLISLILNLFIVWLSLNNAEKILNYIGKGGITGIAKVMALLLAAIAIMMIRMGIENIIKTNINK
jgi:multiple antibiotic resistance protein